MFNLQSLLASSLVASVAVAHFTLDYPPTRGFDDEKEPQFCGGFDTAATERHPVPLSGAPIWINSHHTKANVDAFLSTKPDPKTFDDFNSTINGTSSISIATKFFQVAEGVACWNIDFAALPFNLTNGSQITLQIQYDGGDSPLYQCTDLILLEDYKDMPSNLTCTKDAAAAFTATHSAGPSATSPATASGSTSSPATGGKPSSATRTLASVATLVVAAAALVAVI